MTFAPGEIGQSTARRKPGRLDPFTREAMSLTARYFNVVDELMGQRACSSNEPIIDDVLRSTTFSATITFSPALESIDTVFIGNYKDEADRGTSAEPYVAYVSATGKHAARPPNRFEGSVWGELIHKERERLGQALQSKPSLALPGELHQGDVRLDCIPDKAYLELVFPVSLAQDARSFEAACRALDEQLGALWKTSVELSHDVVVPQRSDHPFSRRVFLSHSTKDKLFVKRLDAALKKLGVETWLDEGEVPIDQDAVKNMEEGLSRCEYVVVVLSPDFVDAGPWARQEFRAALARQTQQNKAILLPVLYRECEIPEPLRSKAYADFRKSFNVGLRRLALAIRNLV